MRVTVNVCERLYLYLCVSVCHLLLSLSVSLCVSVCLCLSVCLSVSVRLWVRKRWRCINSPTHLDIQVHVSTTVCDGRPPCVLKVLHMWLRDSLGCMRHLATAGYTNRKERLPEAHMTK